MDIIEYVTQEGLVMIPVLFILGEIIKRTETFADNWIPVIVLVASIGLTPWLLGGFTAHNIVQAVLVAGAPVFGHQIYKQTTEEVQIDESIE